MPSPVKITHCAELMCCLAARKPSTVIAIRTVYVHEHGILADENGYADREAEVALTVMGTR